MRNTKLICMLLAVLTLLSAFAGCGQSTKSPANETQATTAKVDGQNYCRKA